MPEGRELARDVTVWQEAGAGSLHTLAAQVEQLQLSLQLRGAVSLLQPQAAVLRFYLTEMERVNTAPYVAAQVEQIQLSLQLRGAVSLLQPQAAVLSFYLTEIERVKIPPFIAAQVDSCSSASSSVCSSLRL